MNTRTPGSIKPLHESPKTPSSPSSPNPHLHPHSPGHSSHSSISNQSKEDVHTIHPATLFQQVPASHSPIEEIPLHLYQKGEKALPDLPDPSLESKLRGLSDQEKNPDLENIDKDSLKKRKFFKVYLANNVDLDELKNLSWSGIPSIFRPWAWKLLMGYLPLNKERRQGTMERKRKDYLDCVQQYFGTAGKEDSNQDLSVGDYSNVDQSIFHQIEIDVRRTNPDILLYQSQITKRCLERILYVWTIRHPTSGYVQGINDLVTPFFTVFLSQHIEGDPENCDMKNVNKRILDLVEADSYWCLSKLVDGIQDSFTNSQPGIQRQVHKLKELVGRIDAQLHDHIQGQGIEFFQFSFRWMNCLLMRETSLSNIVRMWDTYMAEGIDGYSTFHTYVCAAFLISWSKEIKKMEFSELITYLQKPPSLHWNSKDIELVLSQAFIWKSLFQNAPSHLH